MSAADHRARHGLVSMFGPVGLASVGLTVVLAVVGLVLLCLSLRSGPPTADAPSVEVAAAPKPVETPRSEPLQPLPSKPEPQPQPAVQQPAPPPEPPELPRVSDPAPPAPPKEQPPLPNLPPVFDPPPLAPLPAPAKEGGAAPVQGKAAVALPPPGWIQLKPEEQRLIDKAVHRGVTFLNTSLKTELEQARAARFRGGSHLVGRCALPALTLLECGVKDSHPTVQQIARLVRLAGPELDDTYSLALAILFLDRLGRPEDEKWIQLFAMRLMAGQNSRGGWTYQCPLLDEPNARKLLTRLRRLPPLERITSRPEPPELIARRPEPPSELQVGKPGDRPDLPARRPDDRPDLPALRPGLPPLPDTPERRPDGDRPDLVTGQKPDSPEGIARIPKDRLDDGTVRTKPDDVPGTIADKSRPVTIPKEGTVGLEPGDRPAAGATIPRLDKDRPKPAPGEKGPPAGTRPAPAGQRPADPVKPDPRNPREGKAQPPADLGPLPAALQNVPALRFRPGEKTDLSKHAANDDHSNTQFAILGLWVARRHQVPMDRTLALVERRFRQVQNDDGSWGYSFGGSNQRDSMTCTGLLGMALALGLDSTLPGRRPAGPMDPAVSRGLAFLAQSIGREPEQQAPRRGPGRRGRGRGPRGPGRLVGAEALSDLYYLWSVERVAVAYRLPTLEGKDWYRWGAEALLKAQAADGSWQDRFGPGPETSFALLFLTRSNLARDLPSFMRP